jgi:hypothetical protein
MAPVRDSFHQSSKAPFDKVCLLPRTWLLASNGQLELSNMVSPQPGQRLALNIT